MGICQVPKIVIGGKNTEQGSLKIYGKNADALILGDTTHEGGDVKIYRDASGNLQFSLDADAASNVIAMSVYGGVVCQNFLTVGQAALNTTWPLVVSGNARTSGYVSAGGGLKVENGHGITTATDNIASMVWNLFVSGTNSTAHSIKLQIDGNSILEIKATGDGAGGITNEAIGIFAVTPQVQQAHIADPTDLATCISALSTLLADMEGYGWLKSS